MPEKEVFMTEIMRNESNLNTMEGRSFTELIPEFLIAIDHGWSSIKTPSIVFENGITELQTMPATKDNLLEFRGRKYVIGQGRMGKQETKTENENYYLLTLTAIDRIQKECIAKYGKEVPEYIINEVIETGDTKAIAKNKESIMDTINAGLKRYALEVEAKLRELKIDFDFTNVVYVGGGAGVMRRFGSCIV